MPVVDQMALDDRLRPVQAQLLFRRLNERIRSISEGVDFAGEMNLVCECSRRHCREVVRVSPTAYERVRRFPTRFLVKHDHVVDASERVVEETPRFVVVEKFGPDAQHAIRLDPRKPAGQGPRRADVDPKGG